MNRFVLLVLSSVSSLTATAYAATVEFSTSVSTPSPEAVTAGAPEGGLIFDLFVTTDADILSVDQVLVDLSGGSLFQVDPPFGSDAAPPSPEFIALNRALEAHSWITTPGSTSFLGPGLDMADGTSVFGDLTDDGAVTDFQIGRFTVPAGTTGTISGRVSVAGVDGPESFPFSPIIPHIDIFPSPAPGTPLDLGKIVAAGGTVEDAVMFTGNASLFGADFSNQSIANLFHATIDGLSIDIGVDLALATTFRAGTVATADLTINGLGGPWSYQVSAIIPEPTSFTLASLCVLGLAARPTKYR